MYKCILKSQSTSKARHQMIIKEHLSTWKHTCKSTHWGHPICQSTAQSGQGGLVIRLNNASPVHKLQPCRWKYRSAVAFKAGHSEGSKKEGSSRRRKASGVKTTVQYLTLLKRDGKMKLCEAGGLLLSLCQKWVEASRLYWQQKLWHLVTYWH